MKYYRTVGIKIQQRNYQRKQHNNFVIKIVMLGIVLKGAVGVVMQSPTYVSYTTFFTIVHVGNDSFALSDKVVIRNVIG